LTVCCIKEYDDDDDDDYSSCICSIKAAAPIVAPHINKET